MLKLIEKIVPRYAWFPLISIFAINILVYTGSRLITTGWTHYSMWLPIDGHIPFLPWTITIYVLAYTQWIIGYIVIAWGGKDTVDHVASAQIIAKLITGLFFLFLPTTIARPEVTGHGLMVWLVRRIYAVDAPDNLFPSIHCLESWMVFRGTFYMKKASRTYQAGMLIFTLLVFVSTLTTKQHVAVDVIGGVLMVEIGLWIAKKWNTRRVFDWVRTRITIRRRG